MLPVNAIIYLMVLFFLGKPVLFRQLRAGKGGRPFIIYKFRTMTNTTSPDGSMMPDEKRLTRFGAFLRSTSLDELPQLINIFRGEMSFIGPRPLLMEYVPLYSEEQARRLDCVPGLLGWAQINGRNLLSWPERFKLDVWYVENRSFLLEIKIFFWGFKKIFDNSDISNPNHVTMPPFNGN
ncbi:MAG: sugar transferase [Candidatus Riflebacteria bacterium]|nr:sugar transferase [Candidatus Riflebacteria bacterium]